MLFNVAGNYFFDYRIVRNKAAEKAKHVHHQQQAAAAANNQTNIGGSTGGSNGGNSGPNGPVSVIAHAGSGGTTQLTDQRTGSYSINGILGIHHHSDPNGNSIKRKRIDEHGKWKNFQIG